MFSEFIRSSGLNRAAWADCLGISRPYLSDLLNGNKTPSLQLAFKIEQATGGGVPISAWLAPPPAQVPEAPAAEADAGGAPEVAADAGSETPTSKKDAA